MSNRLSAQALAENARQLREVRARIRESNRLMTNLTYDLMATNTTYHANASLFTLRERMDIVSSLERQIAECQHNLNALESEEKRLERIEYNNQM